MQFTIRHSTRYRYTKPVALEPHVLRFQPREDGAQKLIDYQINVSPIPQGYTDHLDLEGNRVAQIWFIDKTSNLDIDVTMKVETLRNNPFDFILHADELTLPLQRTNNSICTGAYLQRIQPDDSVTAFAAELSLSADRNTLGFLDRLNQQLFNSVSQVHRDQGEPQCPAMTLSSQTGACRDTAMLFVDCCRAEGIPARFASGYQKGNLQSDTRELHAWPEVYLTGSGWRGYDPTHGKPVSNEHVTICAAAHPRDAMPVSGTFTSSGARSSMQFSLAIDVAQ